MTPEQLKNSILQLAIQGKLVEQRKEEGTGEELFKEIQEERQKLIEDGKLKKQKVLPEISEDEIPFGIPDNWKWVRLGEIVYNHGQKKPSSTFSYIDIGSIDNKNQRLNENENIIEAEKAPSRARKIVYMNDVLYATVRPYLHNMCIIDKEFVYPPIASTGFAVMACYNNLYNKYLFYYLLSPTFDRYANSIENSKGVAYPAINDERLYNAVVSFPPLAEQKRIVEKIEEFLPLVEKYEKVWTRLEELNKKFPLDMKKSILEEAIKGKLVEQRKEEGTGEELFEEIQKEKKKLLEEGKIKKQKALPEIREDEIPFDIPENWKWVRLGEVGITQTGNTPSKSHSEYYGAHIPFIGPGDINNSEVDYFKNGLSKKGMDYGRKAKKNSILQVCIGGSIGKCCLIDRDVCFNQQINSIYPVISNSKFTFYLLMSPYFKKYLADNAGGTATPIINRSIWDSILIPLPPLAEQKRIVEKIEEFLPLCEKLK